MAETEVNCRPLRSHPTLAGRMQSRASLLYTVSCSLTTRACPVLSCFLCVFLLGAPIPGVCSAGWEQEAGWAGALQGDGHILAGDAAATRRAGLTFWAALGELAPCSSVPLELDLKCGTFPENHQASPEFRKKASMSFPLFCWAPQTWHAPHPRTAALKALPFASRLLCRQNRGAADESRFRMMITD